MISAVFVLALLVGFLTGIAFRDALELLTTDESSGRPVMGRIQRAATWTRDNAVVLAVVSVMLLNAALGVLLIQGRSDLSDYVQCSVEYQTQNNAATKVRSDAAAEVSKKLDKVIRAVAEQNGPEFREAIRKYIKKRDQQDQQRKDNPPPEPPDEFCGEPIR